MCWQPGAAAQANDEHRGEQYEVLHWPSKMLRVYAAAAKVLVLQAEDDPRGEEDSAFDADILRF